MKLGVYLTNKEQVEVTLDMCHVLRQVIPDFDIVVPIPRGGFLPASIIAYTFGKPMATPDMLLKNRCWWTTSIHVDKARENTATSWDMEFEHGDNLKVLLVDDVSYNWFGMLHRTKQEILSKHPSWIVYKIAPYCFERTKKNLDFYGREIAIEHYFEKDLMIRKRGTAPMVCDIDGVLCTDFKGDLGNETFYVEEFLKQVKPYLIPQWKIDIILTGRHEKYRKVTEEWLDHNGVRWDKLIMNPSTGSRNGPHSVFKANTLFDMHLPEGTLCIESSFDEALAIYNKTGHQVICTDTNQLIGAADIGYQYHPVFEGFKKNQPHPEIVIVKQVDENGKPKIHNWLFG